MVSAGTFFLAALLGWFISAFSVLNNRDKAHKQIAILLFIATMLLTVLSVGEFSLYEVLSFGKTPGCWFCLI